jgi:uncharacterized membrane protein
MSWVELLLFVHVAMAIVWVGGGLVLQLLAHRVSSAGDPGRTAALGRDIEWIGTRVFVPASLLAFLTGVLLVVESDFYGFGDSWIVMALLLYAITFFAGLLFFGPSPGGSARSWQRAPRRPGHGWRGSSSSPGSTSSCSSSSCS